MISWPRKRTFRLLLPQSTSDQLPRCVESSNSRIHQADPDLGEFTSSDTTMATAMDVKSQPERTAEKDVEQPGSVARTEKGRWERLWPVIACGAGLFSDGYLNNVRPTQQATPLPSATRT